MTTRVAWSRWKRRAGRGSRGADLVAGFACVLTLTLVGCATGGDATARPKQPSTAAPSSASSTSAPLVATDYQETCSAVSSWCQATSGRVPASLRTPLAFPATVPAGTCPVTQGVRYANHQFGGVALGRGPVRPLIVPNSDRDVARALQGELRLSPGQDGWHQLKTLWFSLPSYQGPVLIRGRALHGDSPVAFGERPVIRDPQMPPGPTVNGGHGYREWPGATWLRSPGCYGWQIDGIGFTHIVVFRAVWGSGTGQ